MSENQSLRITNSSGLAFEFLPNGAIRSVEAEPIRITLSAATRYSRSGVNLWLRKKTSKYEFTPLLGPASNSLFRVEKEQYIARGVWENLDYRCILRLSEKSLSWQWDVEVRNMTGEPVELDLVYVQDVGLKPIHAGLINEYYVSQYLERRILEDKKLGAVVCCRQNMKEATGNPWLMVACKNGAISGSTDGMQFYGKTCRETGIPEGLLDTRLGGDYAGESPVVALQEKPFILAPGESHQSGWIGTYLSDHPAATTEKDLDLLPGLPDEFKAIDKPFGGNELISPVRNFFNTSSFLPVEDLSAEELDDFFGKERRHPEEAEGRLLSFFCGEHDHVVLRTKETMADRPHAHIMQAKTGFIPDEHIMSTTAFAFGVFNSHITQGNTNFNILLSVCTSPFNLSPESGQRIFVVIDGTRFLLGVPSAFEMGLNHCRWIYKHKGYCFQVRTWTSMQEPVIYTDFRVIRGNQVGLTVAHDFDPLNRWSVSPDNKPGEFVARPAKGSMMSQKFPDAGFRIMVCDNPGRFVAGGSGLINSGSPSGTGDLFVIRVEETNGFCMAISGEISGKTHRADPGEIENRFLADKLDGQLLWKKLSSGLSLKGHHSDAEAIGEILPWYGMNALIHYLTPYGLEQFGGAAWGTRDVSQGPVELMLTMGKYPEARKILCTIFSNQNLDGGWPQWWMFDSYAEIRAGDSHGDVFYWVIIALANYLKVTGDLSLLEEVLPYYEAKGTEKEAHPVREHMNRLINMIVSSFIPGTALVPFGGGDWNDSLQPVSKELAQSLISGWTVEMNYQAFSQYAEVYNMTGEPGKAAELTKICENIRADFNKHLVRDGMVAGYGLVEKDGSIGVLLHPRDQKTGNKYSILPMERGILSGIFTREQALHHQDLIEKHLKGPDGARLMDRPLRYTGGIQTIFQRAESSTFFGREIGLMYVHEHIRYAESLARTGKAEAFVKALRQAIPVGYRDIVPCGDIRQANCYYSSSDVAFRTRYEADERYDEIVKGNLTLRGGWRVYSSGPGIYTGLIVTRLLGLRLEYGNVILDPVLPRHLDGLSAAVTFMGRAVTLTYHVRNRSHSPEKITINGRDVTFTHEENPYRQGGAVFHADLFTDLADRWENVIDIIL